MQNDCTNIYQTARKIAGLTQERAAELMNMSVRSLADYETGARIPSNGTVEKMVTVYNSQLLAVQHLRNSAQFARAILPDPQPMRLPEAAITLVEAIHDFSSAGVDHEILRIARDGVISDDEQERFRCAVEQLQNIAAAAIALASVPRAGHDIGQP